MQVVILKNNYIYETFWKYKIQKNFKRIFNIYFEIMFYLYIHSLLLVLILAPRGFSSGTPVFPSPQKPTFPNSNSIRSSRATGLSVPDC